MMIRAKCAPHFMRHVHAAILRRRSCIRDALPLRHAVLPHHPDGKLTPCPYSPRMRATSEPRASARSAQRPAVPAAAGRNVGGKCGRCEYQKNCAAAVARAHSRSATSSRPIPPAYTKPTGAAVIEAPHEVSYGQEFTPALAWSDGRARAARSHPSFVRGVVAKRVAIGRRERGLHEITPELLAEIRSAYANRFLQAQAVLVQNADG